MQHEVVLFPVRIARAQRQSGGEKGIIALIGVADSDVKRAKHLEMRCDDTRLLPQFLARLPPA